MSPWESAGHAAVQGPLLGFGQNINGAVQAIGDKLGGDPRSWGDAYRYNRDAITRTNDKALADNPKAYLTANVLSSIPAAIATGGAGEGATVASVARAGGLVGALNALGNSRADLTTGDVGNYVQAGKDVSGYQGVRNAVQDAGEGRPFRSALDILGAGALGGALTGGATGAATKLLPTVLRATGQGLENLEVAAGRKALLPGAVDSLTKKAPLDAATILRAVRSGGIRFGGTAESNAGRLESLASDAGNTYGTIVDDLQSRGVVGPNSRAIADRLQALGKEAEINNPGNPAIAREYYKQAERILDASVAAEDAGIAPTARLGLRQAENAKRGLQDLAAYGDYKETPLNEARRTIASVVRDANEGAVADAAQRAGRGSEIADIAENFVPIKQKTGQLIEARDAAIRGAAKASHRTLIPALAHLAGPEALIFGAGTAMHNAPGAAALALATHLLRTRGPSSVAVMSGLGSDLARGAARMSASNPRATLGLLNALSGPTQRADNALQSDPEREAILRALLGAP